MKSILFFLLLSSVLSLAQGNPDLGIAIRHLFPNAVSGKDYSVQDDSDGTGPKIKSWNLPDPQPTPAQITAAAIAFKAARAAQQASDDTERTQAATIKAKLDAGQTLTNAELNAVLKYLLKKVRD